MLFFLANYQKQATNTLQLLKTLIQNGGDLNDQNRAGTTLEKAHLRLAAAVGMLKICYNDAMTAASPNGDTTFIQNTAVTSQILTAQQWHVLATVILDENDFVRDKFMVKLHKGLISLALGLEFLAVLSLGGTFSSTENTQFKNKLR